MNDKDKQLILKLKAEGLGYKAIAKEVNLPVSSISSFIQRRTQETTKESFKCKNCGLVLKQTKGHRQKTFCSDKCRFDWWKKHPDEKHNKNLIECKCVRCNKEFMDYSFRKRKYCSKNCYLVARSGGDVNE